MSFEIILILGLLAAFAGIIVLIKIFGKRDSPKSKRGEGGFLGLIGGDSGGGDAGGGGDGGG